MHRSFRADGNVGRLLCKAGATSHATVEHLHVASATEELNF